MVKVVDIVGVDTSHILEVEIEYSFILKKGCKNDM